MSSLDECLDCGCNFPKYEDCPNCKPPIENTPIPAKQGEGPEKMVFDLYQAVGAFTTRKQTDGSIAINRDDVLDAIDDCRQALANLTEQDEVCSTCGGKDGEHFPRKGVLDEWQPVTGCPRTGEYVLLYDGEFVYIGWRGMGGETYSETSADVDHGPATHWKPLPQPPIGNLPNTEMENPNG